MNAAKMSAPVCQCGKQARHIQMLTFSYDYCDACKVEVGGKAAASDAKKPAPAFCDDTRILDARRYAMGGVPVVPPPPPYLPPLKPSNLPQGYVALKGENVTCSTCGYEHGQLIQDLPDDRSSMRRMGTVDWSGNHMLGGRCCIDGDFTRYDVLKDETLFHISGWGWV